MLHHVWRADFRLVLLAPLASQLACANPAEREVRIRSTKDGSEQPAILYVPPSARATGGAPAPLIVGLHSWSTGYARYDSFASTLRGCERRGWIFLSPHFRGPNNRPEACASELVVQDVLDAVAFAQSRARVDARRIFLTGGSGGGHVALVMAHRAPTLWAGVSAYVPITDLAAFHRFNRDAGLRFAALTELCCGGPPGRPEADAEYRRRSPIHFLAAAKGIPVDLNIGVRDGHDGTPVPIDQGLNAFNVLASANGHATARLGEAEIADMTRTARVPEALRWRGAQEPGRRYPILLRRTAGPVRLTVFDGGHVWDEGVRDEAEPALDWIAELVQKGGR